MTIRGTCKVVVVLLWASFLVACSTDGDEGAAGPAPDVPAVDAESVGLWDDGPCDPDRDPLVVGLLTVFASPVISLEDQALALEASADAFNERGGVNGACIETHTCDERNDPNQALECVRELEEQGVVATINDTTTTEVTEAFVNADIPRFAISPNTDDYGDPNSYPFDAGGVGTSLMMPQGLLDRDITRYAVIRVDVPQASALAGFLESMYEDDGLELVADIPVPGGTTDYQQFVIAAEDAGAEGVAVPLGGQEAIQLLRAAQQLGSDLVFSSGLGTFSYNEIESLGDFAQNVVLNAAVPPATYDDPVVDLLTQDLAASGHDELQRADLRVSPIRTWVGMYSLVRLLRDAGAEEFTRETVRAAIEASGEIDMLGLTADWTPLTDNPGVFPRTGTGHYAFWGWDPDAGFDGRSGNLVLLSEANFLEVSCGSSVGGPC